MAQEPRNESTNAFTKACSYLNFNARAKWAAHLAGAGTGIVAVGLLTVLWLFADLTVWRGRIPAWFELSQLDQEQTARRWNRASTEQRATWLTQPGFDESSVKDLADMDFADLSRDQTEAVWERLLYARLAESVRPDAAESVFISSEKNPPVKVLDHRNHGILSLVVREQAGSRFWTPFPRVARWNRWMWNDPDSRISTYLSGLFVLAAVLGLLWVFLLVLNREMAARASIEATTRLRRAVYHHTFRLGTLAVRAMGPSEAVSLLARHIEAVQDALYFRLTEFFRAPFVVAVLLLFAVLLNPLLAIAFLLFAVLVWVVGVRIVAYFRKQSKQATTVAAERLTIIRESLMLMRLVKCYLMEQFNQARIERQLSRYAQVQLVRYRGESMAEPALVVLGGTGALVLMFVGGLLVLHGDLHVANAVAMTTTLLGLYLPIERWLEGRRLLKRGKQSSQQVFSFLERRGEVGQVVGAEFLPPLEKQLEFDNVTLRDASTGRNLLEEVSLNIPAGHRVGLIGADELEKQALVYLIPRLLDPTSGEIRIDQHNLRWVTLDSLRTQIGLVLMHNLVFHDSVKNNIGCGDTGYTLPQIIEAAKMAHAHHFIQKLPQGYETPIGELGHSLTTSEQFRIALARAILRDPALVIIEEPETDLDEDTKSLLDDTMTRLLPGRTAIFLPHRVSTLRSCNTIHLINKGRIVASGTHKDLLSGNKLYRHLHYLEFNQIGEQV